MNTTDWKRSDKKKMMLNMSNKFESYQRGGVAASTPSSTSMASSCSADLAAAAMAAAASKADRESIHSGQFMVSHFEAEEAQDDLDDDDGEVKMLDPEDPTLSKPFERTPCMEVQLYVPRKAAQLHEEGGVSSASMVTSQIEIETSLTKLFKCMNLAYSQKLTSPKWNHFKGVRLRWKDKIRLNNVIWRCWHMQFILKRRTPVCQFASPLDVDIHSNPQSVVLEGKYWKRQLAVIKAEYRKWRRNFKSKATGCLTYDTRSEFDFLEWSPLNERNLMLSEDWTSDTLSLFSAINGPFPFPDPREIARGAGIADFIQPSLGPLQPNLDDIDLTFAELLHSSRLPPVPEEGSDEMLKNVDYGFSAIMGSEQMDSSNIMDTNSVMQSNDDTNMLELNTPLNSMQFADIEQQFATRQSENVSNRVINADEAMMTVERGLSEAPGTPNRSQLKHYAASSENRQNSSDFSGKSVIKGRISKNFQRPFRREPHNYDKAQPTFHQTTIYQQMLAEQQKTQQGSHHQQHLLPNASANVLQHQASTFQIQQPAQMQYPSQQFTQSTPSLVNIGNNNYGFSSDASPSSLRAPIVTNNLLSIPVALSNAKAFGLVQTGSNVPSTQSGAQHAQTMMLNVKTEPPSPDVMSMYSLGMVNDVYGAGTSNSYKPYPSAPNFKKSSSTGTYINMRGSGGGANQGYMQDPSQGSPHMHTHSLPIGLGSQLVTLPNPLQRPNQTQSQLSPTSSQQQQQQQQQQHQQHQHILVQQQQQSQHQSPQQPQPQPPQGIAPKEMFRSNSLPLNVSLQKFDTRLSHDNFAVPKYHAKSSKSRSRSNSIHQHMSGNAASSSGGGPSNLLVSQQLQAATSDPMLNSTLAQLLTSNSRMTSLGKQQSSSTSAISTLNMPMTATGSGPVSAPSSKPQTITVTVSNVFASPTQSSSSSSSLAGPAAAKSSQEMLHQRQQQVQMHQQQKSPKKSTSLPVPSTPLMLHSPPHSKVMSYPPPAGSQASCSTLVSFSPDSFHDQDSPLSPTHSLKYPRDNQRRAGHIHAEQKRRYNIKNGFDMLHSLIPQLQQNPNAKLSKAAMLQKGADHIKHLRSERNLLKDKMEALRKERDTLNNSLMHLHSILPANGAPVTRQGTEHVRQLYDQYVRYRTMNNWKFWILGLILEPLLASYTASVSSASMEELRRTAFLWVDQHCSLIDLRPAVSNKLKYLSMKTDILSDPPSTLQEEVAKAVHHTADQHPNLHGT